MSNNSEGAFSNCRRVALYELSFYQPFMSTAYQSAPAEILNLKCSKEQAILRQFEMHPNSVKSYSEALLS